MMRGFSLGKYGLLGEQEEQHEHQDADTAEDQPEFHVVATRRGGRRLLSRLRLTDIGRGARCRRGRFGGR
jgi:hypothetical protein